MLINDNYRSHILEHKLHVIKPVSNTNRYLAFDSIHADCQHVSGIRCLAKILLKQLFVMDLTRYYTIGNYIT